MNDFETIRLVSDGPVATITLNRPERHNAYSIHMRDELYEAFRGCGADDQLQLVVLRGAGPSFCAGADLAEFGQAPAPFEARRIRFARDVWGALRGIPCPVIAVLHGHVIGTGLEMALQCDIRIADETLRARMPEARVGLVPAAGGTQVLPREIGLSQASRLLVTGITVGAAEAWDLGLIHRLFSAAVLETELRSMVEHLLAWPEGALRVMKRCLTLLDELPVRDAIEHERRLASAASRASA
jgi:enoyl-CoA hydratase/carnithine racemase